MRIHFQLFAVAQLASFGDAFVIPRRAPIALFRPQISMSKPNPPDGPPPEDLLEPNLPFYLEEPDVEEEVKSEVVEASVDEVAETPEEDEPDEEESVQKEEKTSDESKEKEEVTLNEIVKAETVEASADEVVDTPEEDEPVEDERDEEESVQEEEKTPDEESKEKEEVTLNETDEAFAEAINDFQQRAAARIRLTSWWLEDVLVSQALLCICREQTNLCDNTDKYIIILLLIATHSGRRVRARCSTK